MVWRTTVSADEDVGEIESFGTLTYGRRRAAKYVDDLFVAFALIAANPNLGRRRDELASAPRLLPHGAHHIFYTVEGRDILILRVLGKWQDWSNLF
jgi:toxin ParE1/3/4